LTLKIGVPPLILEKHFYLTTLQAELRVTTLCIERGSLRREPDCEELVGGYSQEMM
jgi:hypothetical protein